jgi:hypothetical protein
VKLALGFSFNPPATASKFIHKILEEEKEEQDEDALENLDF